MADPRLDPGGKDDPRAGLRRGSTTGPPRWVRVLGIVLAIGLLALLVVLHLTGTLGSGVHR